MLDILLQSHLFSYFVSFSPFFSRDFTFLAIFFLFFVFFPPESRSAKAPSGFPMAGWVMSECGFKPLPPIFPRPRAASLPYNTPSKPRFLNPLDLKFSSTSLSRSWELRVSAPLRVEEVKTNEADTEEFDPGAPPPFKLSDIRDAIPKHCWVKDPWRSMSYVVRDVAVVLGLAATAAYFNNWFFWPLYWAVQGTMFWALFVLGHDW